MTSNEYGSEITASEQAPAHRPHVTQTFAVPFAYECSHDLPTPCRDADHCATRHLDRFAGLSPSAHLRSLIELLEAQ